MEAVAPPRALADVRNPFRSSIVNDPWTAADPDVPQIHQAVFADCLWALEYVAAQGRSTSLLIHGSAGSGKTHLLGRLRRRIHHEGWREESGIGSASASNRSIKLKDSAFSWIRLNAPAVMLWRHVRRNFVNDLVRPKPGRSPLLRMLVQRLAVARPAEGSVEMWWDYAQSETPDDVDALIEQVVDESRLERAFAPAIRHWLLGRETREATAWLRGDSLPDESLRRLGLPPEGEDIHPEHAAREAMVGLCRLLAPVATLAIGFDQVEALQSRADDLGGLFAFGQLMSVLHDETTNLLLLSCVQSSFAQHLKDKALGADYDRMKEFGLRSLADLDWGQAAQLIAARFELAPELAAARPPQADRLWPLREADVRGTLVDGKSVTPRVLLARAAELFDAIQHGRDRPATPPPSVSELLERAWTERLQKAFVQNEPERTEAIVEAALRPLVQLAQPDWPCMADHLLGDVQLVVHAPDARLGFVNAAQINMTSLASKLKRLIRDLDATRDNPPHRIDRVVLIRDARTPISSNAKKVREHLTALETRGARTVELTRELVAALDAFTVILADARAGDLSFGERTLTASDVETWLREKLPDPLADLLRLAFPPVGVPAMAG